MEQFCGMCERLVELGLPHRENSASKEALACLARWMIEEEQYQQISVSRIHMSKKCSRGQSQSTPQPFTVMVTGSMGIHTKIW